MPAPRAYMERTRGRILEASELLRIASEVQLVDGADLLAEVPRGVIHLGLTDRRLLVVVGGRLTRRARLLAEWPTGRLAISTTPRRVGGNLIHIAPGGADGGAHAVLLSFEWIRGQRPREWEPYRYRQ